MYLITRCAGFIGFHMCQYLLKKILNVIGIDSINQYYSKKLKLDRLSLLNKNKTFKFNNINLCDKKKLKLVLRKTEDLKIIHFAAQPGVMYSYKNPKSYYENNILATKNLVEVTKKLKILKFLFISPSSVNGDKKKYPIKENVQLIPINYYAKTKIECKNIIHKNFKNANHSTKILRPFTVYGPFERLDMLILKMLTFIKKNKEIGIYNFRNYLRDFTYVEDVV
jgi:UDP-glucuronate 4-epimerase